MFYSSLFDEITITFKYKENEFYPMRRYQQLTLESFISNVGGMMGLLAGASVLSLIEFVYFFTLRLLVELLWLLKLLKTVRNVAHSNSVN